MSELNAEYGEMKVFMRNILVFIFYGCIFLNIVFSAYDRFYQDEKIDKIRALQSASFDLKQQYPDLGIRLEPYATDCGAGRNKISYIIEDKVPESLPRQGNVKNYTYHIVGCQGKEYLNIEEDTYIDKLYPFVDFYLYNKFGKSFSGYLKMASLSLISIGMLFVAYKPYLDYNSRRS